MDKRKLVEETVYKIVFCGLAVCGICGISLSMKIGTSAGTFQNNFSNNIFYVIGAVLLYTAWKKEKNNWNKRRFMISVIASLFFATLLICGAQLDYFSAILWTLSTGVKIVLLSIALHPMLYLFFWWLENQECITSYEIKDIKKLKIITFGLIFAAWGTVFLILFPGVYGYDAPNQILQGLGEIQMNVYQPILHTFILGRCVWIGQELFGKYEAGIAFYSFIQMTFMAYVATRVCMYVYEKTKRIQWWIGCMFFFILFPLHAVLAVSTTKDIFFTGIFVLIFIKVMEMTENPKEVFSSKKYMFFYSILLFFLFWFRSNGIYIILFMVPFMVILLRKFWKKILIYTIIPMIAFISIQNMLLTFCDIGEGHALREMLSIPCQQIARAYTYNENDFTSDEKSVLFEIIPEETFDVYPYRQTISDSIKGALNTEQLKKDPIKYLSLYLKIGIKAPKSYIEGAMLSCLGTWYPNKYYQDERQYHPYVEIKMIDAKSYSPDYLEFERTSFFPKLEQKLTAFFSGAVWTRLACFASIFTLGTYTWVILIYIFYVVLTKKYKYLIPASMFTGLIITIILGPVSLIRYGYPLIVSIPIVIMKFRYNKDGGTLWIK